MRGKAGPKGEKGQTGRLVVQELTGPSGPPGRTGETVSFNEAYLCYISYRVSAFVGSCWSSRNTWNKRNTGSGRTKSKYWSLTV